VRRHGSGSGHNLNLISKMEIRKEIELMTFKKKRLHFFMDPGTGFYSEYGSGLEADAAKTGKAICFCGAGRGNC